MGTNYFDFDPWGMAGNSWASENDWDTSSTGTNFGGILNMGAATQEEPSWNPPDHGASVFENFGQWPQPKQPGQTSGGQWDGLSSNSLPSFDVGLNNLFSNTPNPMQSINPQLRESLDSGYWGNNPLTLGSQPTTMSNGTFEQAKNEWSPFDIGESDKPKGWLDSVSAFAKKNPDMLRLIGGLYGAYKGNKASGMYEDLAKKMISQSNPYAKQYAAQHYDYFKNPGKWMNSPYVQVPYKQASEEYMRQMAAQGRTNPNEMGYNKAKMLNDMASKSYKDWMTASYPWGQVNPDITKSAAGYKTQADQAKWNQYNGLLEGLLRMTGVPQQELGTTKTQPTEKLTGLANDAVETFNKFFGSLKG